jgi:hypothetical protein
MGGRVKSECLAKGVNPDRISVVLQEVGGLGLRLTSSSCKHF